MNGARSDQGNIILDGIRVNQEGGQAFQSVLPVTLDSVQEFVAPPPMPTPTREEPAAPRWLGDQERHQQLSRPVYQYLRNTYTNANDYFNKLTQLQNCTLPNPDSCNTPPKLIRNIFGGSIGGPIKKRSHVSFLELRGDTPRGANCKFRRGGSQLVNARRRAVLPMRCVESHCGHGLPRRVRRWPEPDAIPYSLP